MPNSDSEPIERLLAQVQGGGPESVEHLTEAMYQQLREMADRHLRRRFGRAAVSLTVQPTALVNETMLRVIRNRRQYDVNGEFFAIVNTVMERVLLDYIRERRAQKRGGGRIRIEFNPDLHAPAESKSDEGVDVEALFAAMERLGAADPRKADVARMRLLWDMQIQEISDSLGVSRATVERDWSFARAWLSRELEDR